MTELAAFGKDEGTLHLENSNAVGITDLLRQRRWKVPLRKQLNKRPLVWFVDDESANREWFVRVHRTWFGVLTLSDLASCNRAFDRGIPCDALVTDIFFPSKYPTSDDDAKDLMAIYSRIDERKVSDLGKLWEEEKRKWSLDGFDIARKAALVARSRKEQIPVLLFSRKATLLLNTDDWLGEPPYAVQNTFWILEKVNPWAEGEPARKAAAIQRDRIIAALRYRRAATPWWRKVLARVSLGYGGMSFSLGLDRPWVIGHSGEGIRPHAASAT